MLCCQLINKLLIAWKYAQKTNASLWFKTEWSWPFTCAEYNVRSVILETEFMCKDPSNMHTVHPNKTHWNFSKEKETIYYILKTTYNVSHWTTIYIELCDSVTLGLVIYLLYILSYREREGRQTILFCLYLIFLQLKKIDHWLYKTKVERHIKKKGG